MKEKTENIFLLLNPTTRDLKELKKNICEICTKIIPRYLVDVPEANLEEIYSSFVPQT